jgi:hypothetical protein
MLFVFILFLYVYILGFMFYFGILFRGFIYGFYLRVLFSVFSICNFGVFRVICEVNFFGGFSGGLE